MRKVYSGVVASTLFLAACQGQPVAGPGAGSAVSANRGAARTGTGGTGAATNGGKAPAAADAAGLRLLAPPAAGSTRFKGAVTLDAALVASAAGGKEVAVEGKRVLAPNGGHLIGTDGAAVIANAQNQIIAAGAGNVVAPTGAVLIGTDGASLIGTDGASLVGAGGLNLIAAGAGNLVSAGAGNMRLLQAGEAATSGTAPIAGALVGAFDLATGKPLPIGKDGDKDVYLAYTDASGNFELYLPPEIAHNVLIVANATGNDKSALAVNAIASQADAGAVSLDPGASVIADYLRSCAATRIVAALEPDSSARDAEGGVEIVRQQLTGIADAIGGAGYAKLGAAARRRAVQAGVDRILARTQLSAVTMTGPQLNVQNPLTGTAREVLEAVMRRFREAAARKAAADPTFFERSPIIAFANQLRPANMPWRYTQPDDICDLVIDSFLDRENELYVDQIGQLAIELGEEPGLEESLGAAGLSFFGSMTLDLFADDARLEAFKQDIVAAVKAEVAAAIPEPVLLPPPSPPPFPAASYGPGIDLPGDKTDQQPIAVAVDEARGLIYVGDPNTHLVYRGTRAGDFQPLSAPGEFVAPRGLAVAANGDLFIADAGQHAVYVLSNGQGLPAVVAGSPGTAGDAAPGAVPLAEARFNHPSGLAIGPDGALFVADTWNSVVRRIDTAAGKIATYAGGPDGHTKADVVFKSDTFLDERGRLARFRQPVDLKFGDAGLYVTDRGDGRLRLALPGTAADESGMVTTVAGGASERGHMAQMDSSAYRARLKQAMGLAIDDRGQIHVSDAGEGRIRTLLPGSWMLTLGGVQRPQGLTQPTGIAFDAGDGGSLWVADAATRKIHRVRLTN